ncbi:MAG TPA: hypothetical protein VKZ63_03185, partial [Kofleriaceae bacterium]|nr:hypothetical protein [Kofleriaceae bacterium]
LTRWSGRALRLNVAMRVAERAIRTIFAGGLSRLTAGGAAGLGFAARTRTGLALAAVSGVAGVALAVASVVDVARARDGAERADAAHGIAWGTQSASGVASYLFGSASWVASAARWVGVGGGAVQSGVGVYRLARGLRMRDRASAVVGSLDIGAGAAWIAASLTASPVALGGFLALTAARVVYSNAGALRRAGGRLLAVARRAGDHLFRAVTGSSSSSSRSGGEAGSRPGTSAAPMASSTGR